MFYDAKKPIRPTETSKPRHDLTKTLSAQALLGEERYSAIIQRIRDLNIFTAGRFDALCETLIQNIAGHAQRLPDTVNRHFAVSGGLLEHVLFRTEAALTLLKSHLVSASEASDEFSEEQQLWAYALFSAGLVQGMGKLQTDYHVNLYNHDKHLVKQWNPLLERLSSSAYYDYNFEQPADETLRCRLNILMAKTLMPANGYAWITSDPDVLETWLALVDEDEESIGMLGLILMRAEDLALQEYWWNLSIGQGAGTPRQHQARSFLDEPREMDLSKEQLLGSKFVQWLTTGLANGQFIINQPPLLTVAGGLLLMPEAFEMFSRLHGIRHNKMVEKGFLSLGLHKQMAAEQLSKGIVIQNTALLPETMKLDTQKQGIQHVSALQVAGQAVNMDKKAASQVLSAKGEWQQPSDDVALTNRMSKTPYG